MIKFIRVMLEYGTYPIWLYDEEGVIDNDNPPEWDDDEELTKAFMDVSNLYDTFFIDNSKEFSYIGCPDENTYLKLKSLIKKAMDILYKKNNGKYVIKDELSDFDPQDI